MRTQSVLVPVVCSLLFFYACGEDSTTPPNGAIDVDAGIDASPPAADASGAIDSSSTNDGSVGDAGSEASLDANADGGTDASADAHADGADAQVEAGIPADFALFDENPGANTYGSLNAANWVTSGSFIDASAGTEWFGSGNGNATGSFPNLSIKKNLGGVVRNQPYTVSFYISQHEPNLAGLELSDFSKLRIGGLLGTVVWTSTPDASAKGVWVQWVGTYTPDPADVGGPFYFEATFDLPGMHTVSFDGPIRAVP